jgi:hypothetical protein
MERSCVPINPGCGLHTAVPIFGPKIHGVDWAACSRMPGSNVLEITLQCLHQLELSHRIQAVSLEQTD